MHRTFMRTTFITASLALALTALPSTARGQVILTPFAGATFSGDAPKSQLSTGASLLFMGPVAGLELEAGFTPDFFAESDEILFVGDSNVTSLMANLVIGVGAGPVRPYLTGGAGLLRSRVDPDDFFACRSCLGALDGHGRAVPAQRRTAASPRRG